MGDYTLWGLFLSAFLSSTLFPGGSEAMLAYLSVDTPHNPAVLFWVATLGNTLGGMLTWGMGWLIAVRYPARNLVKTREIAAIKRIQRWGSPVLLLSWLPVIGDPLCLAAGWLRIHWLSSFLFILLGKAARYVAILWVMSSRTMGT